jgi:hypothetical protein
MQSKCIVVDRKEQVAPLRGLNLKCNADLEESQGIELHLVAEAINDRAFDRKLFG